MEKITYTIIEFMGDEVITYEKDGVVYSIPKDPANSDYQRYLNPEAEQSTPSVTNGD
jgi:hypothetical protein